MRPRLSPQEAARLVGHVEPRSHPGLVALPGSPATLSRRALFALPVALPAAVIAADQAVARPKGFVFDEIHTTSALSANEARAAVDHLMPLGGKSTWRYPNGITIVDYGMWTTHYSRDSSGHLSPIFSLEFGRAWTESEVAATLGIECAAPGEAA